jgi:hypothetical protein
MELTDDLGGNMPMCNGALHLVPTDLLTPEAGRFHCAIHVIAGLGAAIQEPLAQCL